MIDEMAIKKHVSWDGYKFRGYVDVGNGIDDDSSPVAKVNVNGSWKVPCAYFLIDGLNGSERANLVKLCIQRLSDVGIKVVSLTCDGPSCHFTMISELEASLHASNLVPSFPHPVNEGEKVHVLLDVCHMIKLVRNTWAQGGILVDGDNNQILWQYLVDLQKLQDKEGLRLGNKLKSAHIQWWQQKMKVNLAAQALSSSVADALEYCASVLKLKQFQGCEATVKFIRLFDQLFDVLNCRNPFGREFKSALRVNNKSSWDPFLTKAYDYILHLRDPSGQKMHETRRKTGFIGFLVAIKSTKALFHDLVETPQAPLTYLVMYKFSQDHLELFFAAVRSAGGFNNNPTAQQFTATYKRLLLRSSVQGGKGNCIKLDPTEALYIHSVSTYVNNDSVTLTNAVLIMQSWEASNHLVFPDLEAHRTGSAVDDTSHDVFHLVKLVAKCYYKIRLYHLGMETTSKLSGLRIRMKLCKIVLFEHQY
ncbi:DNA transposase THAP9 [Holothuria leucospilota]|uniref:DNA transposase THAP9 n=1 Tax=Holothuria leucospilota TaxID=206669 RepID=A0A9Q1HEY4_HOLLE|nr:DNA transposase THAP9 [Holothuria leucospilota]